MVIAKIFWQEYYDVAIGCFYNISMNFNRYNNVLYLSIAYLQLDQGERMFQKIVVILCLMGSMSFGMSLSKLNSATKDELMQISGIGEKKAAAIIKERRKGKFKSFDDLQRVDGIGEQIASNVKHDVKAKKDEKRVTKKRASKKTSKSKKESKKSTKKTTPKTKSESKKSKAKKAEKSLKKKKKENKKKSKSKKKAA